MLDPDEPAWVWIGMGIFADTEYILARKIDPQRRAGWMGHLKDLLGEREEAIKYYKQALEYDTGETMRHDQFRMRINREWVEKRLKVPFAWKRR